MERIKFNKHYLGKCYINFYNSEPGFLDDLIHDLKRRLNYKDGRGDIETSEVKMYLICKGGYFFWSGFEPNPNEGYINCGDNANMFLAIAALRDDSDYMQWFTNGYDEWFQDKQNDIEVIKYGPGNPINFHKATINELIEHFK